MRRTIMAAGVALAPLAAAGGAAGIAAAAPISIVKPSQTYTMTCRYDSTVGGILVYNLTGRVLPLEAVVEIRLTYGTRYPYVRTTSFRVSENLSRSAILPGWVARFKSEQRGFRHCSAKVTLAGHFAR